jgi:hypothetical protein
MQSKLVLAWRRKSLIGLEIMVKKRVIRLLLTMYYEPTLNINLNNLLVNNK